MRPAKFEFFINLQTAQTLDIKMPPQRLAVADPSRLSSTVWRAATRSEPGYSSLPHRVRVSRTCAARSDRASNPVEKTAIAGWRASAHDRGHGCAQAQPAHTTQPHLELPAVRRLAQTLAGYGGRRVRRFELHLIESGESICNRDRVMTEYDSCSASRCVATLSAGYSRPLTSPSPSPSCRAGRRCG
jgi:hypothetical protein